jgi:hypothetical protein
VQHTRSTCPSHCPSALPTPSPFHSSRSPFPIFPSRTLHVFPGAIFVAALQLVAEYVSRKRMLAVAEHFK